eukprot:Rmarinus@m.1215
MADLAKLEQLLQQLMSNQNAERQMAEQAFNEAKKQPDALVFMLMQGIRQSSHVECRSLAAVLLRSNVNESWDKLSDNLKAGLNEELWVAIENESSDKVRRQICNVVEIWTKLSGQVQPVMAQSFKFVKAQNPSLKEAALVVIGSTAEAMSQVLVQHLNDVCGIFQECLGDQNPGVRRAALEAICHVLQKLENMSDIDVVMNLMPSMLAVLQSMLADNSVDDANNSIKLLIEIAEAEPKFVRKHMAPVTTTFINIAAAQQLDEATRQLAVEFLVSLAENAPAMCRKHREFASSLIHVALEMMLELEDDSDWYERNDNEDDDMNDSNFAVGQEALDRLALRLGGKKVFPLCQERLPSYLDNADWRYRHAGLLAISQIGEGCLQQLKGQLRQVVERVLKHFQDPHPRVRWAAINCIGQMCTDFGPDLQESLHDLVVPALTQSMDDQQPRVASHSAAAVINFCSECPQTVIEVYLSGMLQKLLRLLQSGKRIVQEEALTAVAAIADVAQEKFGPYYDTFMPFLKQALQAPPTKENAGLRGRAIECTSIVACAVGKEKFLPDAQQILEYMKQLQGMNLPPDDPQSSYLLQAWTRMCRVMEGDFAPYMACVMPPLLEAASVKADVKIVTADNEHELEGMEILRVGDMTFGVPCAPLEEKATACSMLACYIDLLKEGGIIPYLQQIVQVMVPLLDCKFNETIQSSAIQSMAGLLAAAKTAVQNGQIVPPVFQEMWAFIYDKLFKTLLEEEEVEMQCELVECVSDCLEVCGEGSLDSTQLSKLGECFMSIMRTVKERKEARDKSKGDEYYDEEEEEVFLDEDRKDDELLDQIGNCLGTLLKAFKQQFLPVFDNFAPVFVGFLRNGEPIHKRIALCVFDSLIEYLGAESQKYADGAIQAMLQYAGDDDEEVRQAAVYGIGVAAQHVPDRFKQYAQTALMRLNVVISHQEARSDSNEMATDNAISALGKICEFQADVVEAGSLWPTWLAYLPCKGDIIEARIVHAQLVTMVERNNTALLGPNNENLPKIIAVFAEILETDLVDDETTTRIKNLFGQMQAIGKDVLQALVQQVPEARREVLLRHLSL